MPKPSRVDIAPVTPVLPGARISHTALVDDEVRREPVLLEVGRERRGVVRFVVGGGARGEGVALGGEVGVVVGDVGGETADFGGGGHGEDGVDFVGGCFWRCVRILVMVEGK